MKKKRRRCDYYTDEVRAEINAFYKAQNGEELKVKFRDYNKEYMRKYRLLRKVKKQLRKKRA